MCFLILFYLFPVSLSKCPCILRLYPIYKPFTKFPGHPSRCAGVYQLPLFPSWSTLTSFGLVGDFTDSTMGFITICSPPLKRVCLDFFGSINHANPSIRPKVRSIDGCVSFPQDWSSLLCSYILSASGFCPLSTAWQPTCLAVVWLLSPKQTFMQLLYVVCLKQKNDGCTLAGCRRLAHPLRPTSNNWIWEQAQIGTEYVTICWRL